MSDTSCSVDLIGSSRSPRAVEDPATDRRALTALDAVTGDGDHGTAIMGALTAIADAKSASYGPASHAHRHGDGRDEPIVRVDQHADRRLLLGMADGVQTSELDARATAPMFASGRLSNVRRQTKAAVGDRTMLDALIPAVEAMQANCADGLQPMFEARGCGRCRGARRTKDLVAASLAGHAILGDRVLGHVDPARRRWPASSTPLPAVRRGALHRLHSTINSSYIEETAPWRIRTATERQRITELVSPRRIRPFSSRAWIMSTGESRIAWQDLQSPFGKHRDVGL